MFRYNNTPRVGRHGRPAHDALNDAEAEAPRPVHLDASAGEATP